MKYLTSRTIWLALLQGILGVVVVIGTEYPEIGGIAIAKSALDMILRGITTGPVGE